MGMTREERRNTHKKQEKLQIIDGPPGIDELIEGIPVIRRTTEGVVEYITFRGLLYKNVFTKVQEIKGDSYGKRMER